MATCKELRRVAGCRFVEYSLYGNVEWDGMGAVIKTYKWVIHVLIDAIPIYGNIWNMITTELHV